MKKILCLFACLMILISCTPALAASLTPEQVIGTWVLYKMENSGSTYDADDLKEFGVEITAQFYADGKCTFTTKTTQGIDNNDITWQYDGNTVVIYHPQADAYLDVEPIDDGSIMITDDADNMYFRKTKDTTDKTVKKAITSTGTYKLNNSKKTASFISPVSKSASSLTVPETVTVSGTIYKVTEIGAGACKGMAKLTQVTVGKNVKTIGKNAFSGCKKLKKITLSGKALKKIGADAFSGIKKTATVTCPKAKLAKYKKLLKKAGLPEKAKVKGK